MFTRLRRRAYYKAWQANAEFSVRVQGGATLRLPARDQLAEQLLRGFEAGERRLVASLLRRGDVVYDIGANVGLYTLIAARRVGAEGVVYAFEPAAETFAILEQNIARNGLASRVRLFRSGVSDVLGALDLLGGGDYRAYASFAAPNERDHSGRRERVRIQSLDELVPELRPPTFVKIDVEGWESRVLRGAESTLTAHHPDLLVEFNAAACTAAGTSTAALYAQLVELGYRLYRLEDGRAVPEPPGREYHSENLLATTREDAQGRPRVTDASRGMLRRVPSYRARRGARSEQPASPLPKPRHDIRRPRGSDALIHMGSNEDLR